MIQGKNYPAHYPRMRVDGIIGYSNTNLHFDTNGAWGGKRAVFAHFKRDDDASVDNPYAPDDNPYDPLGEIISVYIYVGNYWEIGRGPDFNPDNPSAWEIAKMVIEAMENGADRRKLYKAIQGAVNESTETI